MTPRSKVAARRCRGTALGVALAVALGVSAGSGDEAAARPYTAAELKALREMAQDVQSFKKAADSYRGTVDKIVKRAYEFRRKKLLAGYGAKIKKEESEERVRRIAAITLFEDFLRRYPNDKRWTPDVIFRLAELYFEKSNDQYLTNTERYEEDLKKFENKQIASAPTPPKQDYSQTIDLHRRLIREFPRYRLVDGAYYLLGFCLSEMGKEKQGKQAFLSLVCKNRYQPPLTADDAGADSANKGGDKDKDKSKAKTVAKKTKGDKEPAKPKLDTSVYDECKPLRTKGRFNAEAWIRVGEYHFDENELGPAIAAYRKVLQIGLKNNPYYDEALYKLAWTYYRDDKFMAAIKNFDRLIVFADKEKAKTGKAGSEMRPESIQYLGISFAEDDWDGDTVPDAETGLQRIEKFYAGRHKEKHVYQVYRKLADIYFDTTKYDKAVEVYKLMLKRWPYRAGNPELQDRIIMAHERRQEAQKAIAAREEFTRLFGKGSEWERRNRNNPKALKKAREFDEQMLIQAAVHHHKAGQRLRKRGTAMSDVELLKQAAREYDVAAKAYQKYLARFPDTKNSYEIRYSYALCLFYSQKFLLAATAFAKVRDSNLDDRYRSEAAFMATKSYEVHIKQSAALKMPPLPSAKSSLSPRSVPDVYRKWQKSLDTYAKLLPKDARSPKLAYKAAEIPYRYHQMAEARKRFAAIHKKFCGSQMAANAATAMLVTWQIDKKAAKRLDMMEKWATELAKGKCTAGKANKAAVAGTKTLLDGIKFKRAQFLHDKADKLLKAGNKPEAFSYYDQAAKAYLALVALSPKSKDADSAIKNAAICYEGSRRAFSATKLYERLYTEYPQSKHAAEAVWRAGVNYSRFFEFNKAVTNYLILADSPKYKGAKHRDEAVLAAAKLLYNDRNYTKAAKLYLRYARKVSDRKRSGEAYFRAGECYAKLDNFPRMVAIFRAFGRQYRGVSGLGALRVEAPYQIAEAARKRRDWRTAKKYYRTTMSAYSNSGEKAGGAAAIFAAKAAFTLAERELQPFLKTKIKGGIKAVARGRKRLQKRAERLKAEFEKVYAYKSATWTVAAAFRVGTILEHVAKTVASAFRQIKVPRKIKRLGQDAVDMYQQKLDEALDRETKPLEKAAKGAYAACVKRASALGISNKYTELARQRLNVFDPDKYPLLKAPKVKTLFIP